MNKLLGRSRRLRDTQKAINQAVEEQDASDEMTKLDGYYRAGQMGWKHQASIAD